MQFDHFNVKKSSRQNNVTIDRQNNVTIIGNLKQNFATPNHHLPPGLHIGPPPSGVLKSNWDVVIDRQKHIMGVGLVLRDHSTKAVAARCLTHLYVFDPAISEAFACGSMWDTTVQRIGHSTRYLRGWFSRNCFYPSTESRVESEVQQFDGWSSDPVGTFRPWSCTFVCVSSFDPHMVWHVAD